MPITIDAYLRAKAEEEKGGLFALEDAYENEKRQNSTLTPEQFVAMLKMGRVPSPTVDVRVRQNLSLPPAPVLPAAPAPTAETPFEKTVSNTFRMIGTAERVRNVVSAPAQAAAQPQIGLGERQATGQPGTVAGEVPPLTQVATKYPGAFNAPQRAGWTEKIPDVAAGVGKVMETAEEEAVAPLAGRLVMLGVAMGFKPGEWAFQKPSAAKFGKVLGMSTEEARDFLREQPMATQVLAEMTIPMFPQDFKNIGQALKMAGRGTKLTGKATREIVEAYAQRAVETGVLPRGLIEGVPEAEVRGLAEAAGGGLGKGLTPNELARMNELIAAQGRGTLTDQGRDELRSLVAEHAHAQGMAEEAGEAGFVKVPGRGEPAPTEPPVSPVQQVVDKMAGGPRPGVNDVILAEAEARAAKAAEARATERANIKDAWRDLDIVGPLGLDIGTATERIELADKGLVAANREYTQAMHALGGARIRASINDVTARAMEAGASKPVADLIANEYARTMATIPWEDSLITASSLRQRIAHWVGSATGVLPGTVGDIVTSRTTMQDAIATAIRPELERIGKTMDDLVVKEMKTVKYIGPEKDADLFAKYPTDMMVRYPQYFEGMSDELVQVLAEDQALKRNLFAAAEALGYPIKAIEGPYFEQLWDIPTSELMSYTQGLRGKVSVARNRLYGDFVEGVRAGMKPVEATPGQLSHHSTGLMLQAIGDAVERRAILQRYGTRTPREFVRPEAAERGGSVGWTRFTDPLYAGWFGPREIVNLLQQLRNTPPGWLRALQPVALTLKNTVFGPLDLSVIGVHLAEGLMTHGSTFLLGAMNDYLTKMGVPFAARVYFDEGLPHIVQAAEAGVHQGWGPSPVSPGAGTILKWIPKIGEALDKPVSRYVDALAQFQFGTLLTPIRNRIYEGNLILSHLLGQNIRDPLVRRAAADNANAFTGASRGAMTAGRRMTENTFLTSFQMTRSMAAQLGQLAKAAFSPKATATERILGMATLAQFGLMTYGLQTIINRAGGKAEVGFDPTKTDWAAITVGGRTFPLIPQRGLVRAIGKSIVALENMDPEQFALAWTQLIGSRASPVGKVPMAFAGYGFEPGKGYRAGGLSAMGVLLNIAPIPPIIQQIATSYFSNEPEQRSPVALGAQTLGFNEWVARTTLDQRVKTLNITNSDDEQILHWSDLTEPQKIKYKQDSVIKDIFGRMKPRDQTGKEVRTAEDERTIGLNAAWGELAGTGATPDALKTYADKTSQITSGQGYFYYVAHQAGTMEDTARSGNRDLALFQDMQNAARAAATGPGGVFDGEAYGQVIDDYRKGLGEELWQKVIVPQLAADRDPHLQVFQGWSVELGDSGYYDKPAGTARDKWRADPKNARYDALLYLLGRSSKVKSDKAADIVRAEWERWLMASSP